MPPAQVPTEVEEAARYLGLEVTGSSEPLNMGTGD